MYLELCINSDLKDLVAETAVREISGYLKSETAKVQAKDYIVYFLHHLEDESLSTGEQGCDKQAGTKKDTHRDVGNDSGNNRTGEKKIIAFGGECDVLKTVTGTRIADCADR